MNLSNPNVDAVKPLHVVLNNGMEWSTVWVGVISGVVVAVGAVMVAQVFENRRWNAQQESFANTARADRLRDIYGRMAQAAVSLKAVRDKRDWVSTADTADRDERQLQDIRDAINHVAAVGGQILIESTAQQVSTAYTSVAQAINIYLMREKYMEPGVERATKLAELGEEINKGTDAVIQLAKEHLDQLSEPVEVSMFMTKSRHLKTSRKFQSSQF